jgi:hypothetical protein
MRGCLAIDRPRAPTDTEVVRKGSKVTTHITIEDDDDRPERMVRDPDHYFAEARQRAMRELVRTARWLFPSLRHQKRP